MPERHIVSILGRSAQIVEVNGHKRRFEIGERTVWSDGSVTFTGDARQFERPGNELLRALGHTEPAAPARRLSPWGVVAILTAAAVVVVRWIGGLG